MRLKPPANVLGPVGHVKSSIQYGKYNTGTNIDNRRRRSQRLLRFGNQFRNREYNRVSRFPDFSPDGESIGTTVSVFCCCVKDSVSTRKVGIFVVRCFGADAVAMDTVALFVVYFFVTSGELQK